MKLEFLVVSLVVALTGGAAETVRTHENIEWSTGYAFHLTDAKKSLPRVLLVGDSICNGYHAEVQKQLEGKVNVSFWASSYCLTMPTYRLLLEAYLADVKYDVIHFNNGLHSLATDTQAWKQALRETLLYIRKRQPQAKLVWCSSTPLTDAGKTAKVRELNAAAAEVLKDPALAGLQVDDLFSKLDPLDRKVHWSDVYHHKAPVRAKEGEWVARSVLTALGK